LLLRRFNHYLQNQKGISLAELIVVMALLSMVLALGYSYYFFGSRTFSTGESQSNMQRDIRQSASFITSELRYATSIEMVGTPTPTSGDGYHYISIEGSRIKHTDTTGNVAYKTAAVLQELTPMFTLKLENGRNIMHFKLIGTNGSQTYELETKVLLYNAKNQAGAYNQGIKYQKP
jgi:prepilin-type N-terminal cleavage/methylation domain-containing protein